MARTVLEMTAKGRSNLTTLTKNLGGKKKKWYEALKINTYEVHDSAIPRLA